MLSHMFMKRYASLISFSYKGVIHYDLNRKNLSTRSFYKGYCRAWVLFIQYILSKQTEINKFNFRTYLAILEGLPNETLNYLIETFQVYCCLLPDSSELPIGIRNYLSSFLYFRNFYRVKICPKAR